MQNEKIISLEPIPDKKNNKNSSTVEKEILAFQSHVICHEFRTPLSNIRMAAESIMYYGERYGENEKNQLLTRILENTEMLAHYLDEIDQIKRIILGELKLNPSKCDLYELVWDVINDVRGNSKKENAIIFNEDCSSNYAYIDLYVVKLVLKNLLGNAVKYSKENAPVNFFMSFDNKNIVFSIEDIGIGIPSEDLQRIYEPNFHALNAINQGIQGTGNGLFIVKKMVELHGGKISVESKIDVGSEFKVIIPVLNLIPE